MHLSNFRPVKRVTDVVEIFALVREKMKAKLVMIGDGPDRGAAEHLARKKSSQRRNFPRQARPRSGKNRRSRPVSIAQRSGIFRPGGTRSHGLRSSGYRLKCRRHAGSSNKRRGWLPGRPTRRSCSREARDRNSLPPRQRPRDGQASPHQRQEKVLLQRRNPHVRGLLPQRNRSKVGEGALALPLFGPLRLWFSFLLV